MSPILRATAVCQERASITIGLGNLLQLTSALLLAGVLVGCAGVTNSDHGRSNHTSAPTLTITATPNAITLGSSTTLTWSSTDATSVTFDHGIGQVQPSGSLQQKPPATTTYSATASGPGGMAQASVTVTVGGQQGFQFIANPSIITAGQSSTLTFSAPGATSVTVDHGIGTLGSSGSVSVTPLTTTTYTATANFTGSSMTASVTVTVQSSSSGTVSLTANPATISAGQSATLSWTSANVTSLAINQGVGTVAVPSGSVTVSPSATTVYTITAMPGGATASATVSVNSGVPQFGGVFTYKFDNARTGQNLNESVLTPAKVNSNEFGKAFTFDVDGYVYGQPLYVPSVGISGQGTHNVVYVVTEHDSVYAFDADGKTKSPLWQVSFINPTAGITTIPTADVGSTIFPEIGITSTPVIDPGTGTLYVDASTKENGSYFHRLHALDLTSGAEKFGGPVTISGSVPGKGDGNDGNGHVAFQAKIELQRAGLLLLNNTIYIAFASHGDNGPYHGWVFAYDATSLKQVGIWNATPNGNAGGIWQAGGGLAADSDGSIYGISGNGLAEGGPDYGDTFFRLTLGSGGLSLEDFFTPFDQQNLAAHDIDLGSGGPLLLPDQPGSHPHLLTSAGKAGTIYLIDRDGMGGYNTSSDEVVQKLSNAVGNNGTSDNNFCTPTYWQGRVYYVGAVDVAKAFTLDNGILSTTPQSKSSHAFSSQGATPAISASGNTNGILWVIDRAGVLYAYDATNLATELYNSSQAGTRDTLGTAVRFTVPTIANGRVYIGTKSQLVVYGLFP
jgi:hypothetical protein